VLNRPLLGLIAGLVLGAVDGLTALVSSPEVSDGIAGIVMGSSFKGLLAGVIIGVIARKLKSTPWGLACGTLVALVITAPVAYLNATHYGQPSYYWKIMLPGALVGAIVGFVVMRYGRAAKGADEAPATGAANR
jgi:uncharacterized membrane-anchored protein YhcB (DUF1043 family)